MVEPGFPDNIAGVPTTYQKRSVHMRMNHDINSNCIILAARMLNFGMSESSMAPARIV